MSRIAFRPAGPEVDAVLVHEWGHQPHVSPWWPELAVSLAEVGDYLAGQRALAHLRPWIALADGIPLGYVETYRAAEDPLADHYPARPGDQGWHVLVGPPEALGSGRPRAMVRELVLALFREPGAERVLCEPDARNGRMLSFCRRLGGQVEGLLDLPDKRAALVVWTRERTERLWPGAIAAGRPLGQAP